MTWDLQVRDMTGGVGTVTSIPIRILTFYCTATFESECGRVRSNAVDCQTRLSYIQDMAEEPWKVRKSMESCEACLQHLADITTVDIRSLHGTLGSLSGAWNST